MSMPHVWDAKTHVGAVRLNNEDCYAVDPGRGLFVVCDGMGGHDAGEVASATACATIRDWVAARPPSPSARVARQLLTGAIRAANRRVFGLGANERKPGTTAAAILWARDQFVIAHVGDSRVYRLRHDTLEQLTRDHSLANELVDQGRLAPEAVATYRHRNVLTRALGTRDAVDIAVQTVAVLPGDTFLVASDGLVLTPEAIGQCLQLSPAAAVDSLVGRTLAEGAPDNVTVVVARVGDANRPRRRRLR
ncbi:Protein serine/threonine phosphatase PrpC, regulation of stationary phase [Minicystis rosea]|nr:Protein serine/threonine phosphatase PrpC, regulation of stationary phase [Minicystis rosea]